MKLKYKKYVKLILGLFSIIVLFFLLEILIQNYGNRMQTKYDQEINDYIADELHYEKDDWKQEQDKMLEWIHNKYVSDADRGLLYERMSNIYQFEGDTLGYYKCLGDALYYLQESRQTERAANIYADLANYYINNDSFTKAQEMLDKIQQLSKVDEMNDLQVESYIYRMQAVVDCHEEKYEEALNQIGMSSQCLDTSTEGYYQQSYYAMNDAVSANIYFAMGEYDKAQELVDQYEGSELFEETIYRDILVRDFIIPYYTAAVKLAAYRQDEATATDFIQTYCNYCEEYGYRKLELNTLIYLLDNLPSSSEEINRLMYQKINDDYQIVTDMQSEEYSALIDSQLQNSMKIQKDIDQTEQENRQAIRHFVIGIMATVCLLVFLFGLVYQVNTDGLTKIRNRRALNSQLKWNRCTKIPYAIIMLDIDNFKKVNDTYGHGEGDLVLQQIGRILKKCRSRETCAYRYGGEEFVVVVKKCKMGRTLGLAEYIRHQVEDSKWNYDQHITVSIGVADEKYGHSVIEEADDNLYFSKQHGKNVVTFSSDAGKKALYEVKVGKE